MNGVCLTEGVVYRAKVLQEDTNIEEFYTGMTARSFKQRLYEHRTDFNNRSRKGTRLSKHVWSLKSQKIPYTVSWEILAKAPSFNPATKTCKLCLKEKWFIMFRPEGATLNHRSEFFSTCRHRLKPLLAYTWLFHLGCEVYSYSTTSPFNIYSNWRVWLAHMKQICITELFLIKVTC